MNEKISELEKGSNTVSVTLQENTLTGDGTYFARVSRNVASFKNIVAEIAEENKGIDPHLLQYAAILIQKKMLGMPENGKAVNMLDLGTLFISMKCKARSRHDAERKGKFVLKFAPSETAEEALKNLSVDKVLYADASPEIVAVENLSPKAEGDSLTAGQPARITGSRLKVGGEGAGIYFAPCDENGTPSSDEGSWLRVDETEVFRNMPSELNIFVPQGIEPGKTYRIIVRTQYLPNGRSRKGMLEAESGIVTAA